MTHLGLDIPNEPPSDYTTHEVISTFYLASRGRAYVGGMAVMPLTLSVRDINEVLQAHPVFADRELLDSCVFALDAIYLADQSKAQQQNSKDE